MKKAIFTILPGIMLSIILLLLVQSMPVMAVQNFPPPEFETEYQMPAFSLPDGSFRLAPLADVGILFGSLALASWLSLKKRSRKGLFITMLGCMLYFGFIRKGCVCPIGAIQNVALAIFDPNYTIDWVVLAFFALPIIFALFFGRVFCSVVCPLGAIQDLAVIRPMRVPRWLENILQIFVWLFLALAVLMAATGTAFIICRFDPFIGIYRFSARMDMIILTGAFLLVSTVIGRPYCRFVCPYGVILRQASRLARWKISIVPAGGKCVQCKLCMPTCPFDAINPPSSGLEKDDYSFEIKKIAIYLLVTALLVTLGVASGYRIGDKIAQSNPTVIRSAIANGQPPAGLSNWDRQNIEAAIRASGLSKEELSDMATILIQRTKTTSALIMAGVALVIGVKLMRTTMYRRQSDYQVDSGKCLSCGRCLNSCPKEVIASEMAESTK